MGTGPKSWSFLTVRKFFFYIFVGKLVYERPFTVVDFEPLGQHSRISIQGTITAPKNTTLDPQDKKTQTRNLFNEMHLNHKPKPELCGGVI